MILKYSYIVSLIYLLLKYKCNVLDFNQSMTQNEQLEAVSGVWVLSCS